MFFTFHAYKKSYFIVYWTTREYIIPVKRSLNAMKSFEHFPVYNMYKDKVILVHFGQKIMEAKLSVKLRLCFCFNS